MPELERFVLHRLAELDGGVREAYGSFDYKRVVALLNSFLTTDLSAFYFDIRKDVLYCDPMSSHVRKSVLTVIDVTFRAVATWIAPILVFTAEEAWLARYPNAESVHLETFPDTPAAWRDDALAESWAKIRRVRRVVTGALEIERAQKRIGASLEAAPVVHVADESLREAVEGLDLAEICITSGIRLDAGRGPGGRVPSRRREGRGGGPGAGRGPQMRPLVEGLDRSRHRSRLSGRDAARCAGPARMGPGEGGCVRGDRPMTRLSASASLVGAC